MQDTTSQQNQQQQQLQYNPKYQRQKSLQEQEQIQNDELYYSKGYTQLQQHPPQAKQLQLQQQLLPELLLQQHSQQQRSYRSQNASQRLLLRGDSEPIPTTLSPQLPQPSIQIATPTPPVYQTQNKQQQQQQQQQQQSQRSVSILVYKTLNTVLKSSRKIIFRVCEVASAKKSLKMFNLYSSMKNREGGEGAATGHDRFCQTRLTNRPKNRKNQQRKPANKNVRRTNSANEFDTSTLTAASRRQIFSSHRSASSEQDQSDQSEHSEKSPLVSAKLDTLAKMFFSKTIPPNETHSKESIESSLTRPNIKYQYTALDSGNGIPERSPRERAARDRALSACQEWIQNSNGRYDIIAHLDEIGSRHNKNWFLINDTSVRTDRLMTLLPLPPDCVALEELPPCESPKGLLMELLGSLHHPYIYPVLDLGFLHTDSINYACLVMPFNPRGSLKDLIYKAQWNEPWNRKYTRKSTCLPLTQVQRLGRQILEALLFLRERGFPLHGHLHSGNVILQNGVARLSGLENGLLGLSSRVNAVMWSRTTNDIENIDIICFGHLLYEMCVGYELTTPQPPIGVLELDLERYPQIVEILNLIFDPPDGICPTVEDLVLCDLFRNIDLRELRGPCVSTIKPSLSKSTLNLLQAVKKRQSASLGGSFSETSSPCTPPSTPRDRRTGTTDSFDISSDSDGALDEVVITSSSYDSHHYDPLNSPIHFCDNSIQSDDNSIATQATAAGSVLANSGGKLFDSDNEILSIMTTGASTSNATNNQLTTDMCNYKNSKSRRLEYSLRCLKYGRSNPSQDSAFGSLTDGELSIASSSFRLSSFQSITSPIDEGVEDMIIATTIANETSLELTKTTTIQIDSAISSPCREGSPNFTTDDSSKSHRSPSLSPKRQQPLLHQSQPIQIQQPQKLQIQTTNELSTQPNSQSLSPNMQFDPPKILVNDQNSIYTTSPSKRSGTIEVFSQKYRVSSFEDMSPGRKTLKNVNKLAFRSLEEERRIDSAFIPIKDRTSSENRVYVNNSEKYKKLTHTSFSNRINSNTSLNTSRDRHSMWKDSIFYRKNKIAKSNDSLLESHSSAKHSNRDNHELRRSLNRGSSVNEIATCSSNSSNSISNTTSSKRDDIDMIDVTDYLRIDPRKSRSERHLFSLTKLKQQNAVSDCFSEDESFHDNKSLSLSSSSINQTSSSLFKSFDETNEIDHESSGCESSSSPLHHQDICRRLGGIDDAPSSCEEKTPLLDSMEMSPISPNEPDPAL